MYKGKLIAYFFLAVPAILSYLILDSSDKNKIIKDLSRFECVRGLISTKIVLIRLYRMLVCVPEFRSLFYMRIGHISKLIKYFLPGQKLCGIGSTRSANVGGGVYIQHGYGMVLDAEFVGENLWINQNVTVGYRGNGHPRIGNNVRIGTGAVVLGPITIGDNVNIGANAIVVDDVPSNCTVCSPKATIVKRNK